uniref:Uncharacterized protein n=1 Tax=Magallana gigas TaxID=29159 RepID=K1PH97_MAGGI
MFPSFCPRSTTNSTSFNSNVDIPSNQNNGEYADFTNLYEDDNVPYLVGEVDAQYTEPSPTDFNNSPIVGTHRFSIRYTAFDRKPVGSDNVIAHYM